MMNVGNLLEHGRIRRLMAVGMCVLMVTLGQQVLAAEPDLKVLERQFETSIRPLLVKRCQKCHGARRQRGGLRLDSREAMLNGGESGPAIEAGRPDASLLIEAVKFESFEMPPDDPLSKEEIAALEAWIKAGAVWPDHPIRDPHAAGAATGKFTNEDRQYWAFQPVVRPELPEVDNKDWCRNEIDRFIMARLEEQGLQPAAEADARTLLRRLTYDLTGLPPTPEQLTQHGRQAADAEAGNQSYTSLVEELLNSPRYGEQWARHWLDLVRYAESDGFRADGYRAQAWRYRDYVVSAFNRDLPYKQFILEQLAGDELAAEEADPLIATGYLRLYLYEYNQRDARTHWQDILNEVTDVTGDVFLGMGMGCARCHDHKFDPILQQDYFRLQSFLAGILPRDDIPAASRSERKTYAAQLAEWEKQTSEIRQQIDNIRQPYLDKGARSAIEKFPPDIQAIMAKPAADRDPLEKQLADLVNRQVLFEHDRVKYGESDKKKLDELAAELKKFDDLKPQPLPEAITVTDVSRQGPDVRIPGTQATIEPGFLTILDPDPAEVQPLDDSSGRRRALAEWIGRDDNPLTTRVIVNRIWQFHFGRGLAGNPSDLGRLGEAPTHPELLDWLTAEFIDKGWSIRHLHRLILDSATYRQSAFHPQAEMQAQLDPSNLLRWRADVRRLTAEQIRDAALAASGELDLKMGGPSVSANSSRRSIYTKIVRNSPDPLLKAFDAADGFNSTAVRNVTTTATQALLMVNGSWVSDRAASLAERLERMESPAEQVTQAYRLTLSREPSAAELEMGIAFLSDQQQLAAGEKSHVELPPFKTLESRYGGAVQLKGNARTVQPTVPSLANLEWGQFTVETVFSLDSLYPDATVRTVVSQWDNNQKHAGWALGVTSEKSGYQPRNLILQLIGDQGYEVIASDLRPELGRTYYAAVSVDVSDSSEAGVTFYLKALDKPNTPLQMARVGHRVTTGVKPALPVIIGGRASSSRHLWDGEISEVRISAARTPEPQLLLNSQQPAPAGLGWWKFETARDATKNELGDSHTIVFEETGQGKVRRSPAQVALIDLCHVLLNSSEFLYVE